MVFLNNKKGSVLVWTVALGMIMTSVFLFMALKLSRESILSRETLDFFQQKAYLESYAAYLKQLPKDQWMLLRETGIDDDGITGSLNNKVEAIEGVLDYGQSLNFPLNGHLSVEWNQCVQGLLKEKGVLESDPAFTSILNPSCGVSVGVAYDRLALINGINTTFTLHSTGAPTHYRISSTEPIESNEWVLNLKIKLENGRVLSQEEVWGSN